MRGAEGLAMRGPLPLPSALRPVRARARGAAALALVLLGAGASASAGPSAVDARARAAAGQASKMPEPLVAETITDIDGVEAGELELDLNGGVQPPRSAGPGALRGSLELEWRATPALGLGLEVGLQGPLGTAGSARVVSVNGGVSAALLHDPAHDFHLMAEATARMLERDGLPSDPGEPALPVAVGLKAGVRRGRATLRAGAGLGIGSGSARSLPLRASLAALFQPCAGSGGFLGVEADADWGRAAPYAFTPEAVFDTRPLGLPALVGVGVPVRAGPLGADPRWGVLLRIMVDLEHD